MFKVVLLVFFFLFSYASEIVNLQLKWKNSFQFAGFYMAKEKNYYRDLGLDINIIENKHNTYVLEDVLHKKATYGVSDSSLFYWALKGKKIKILMPILENSPIALITTDTSVKRLKDIANKHIATEKNSLKNPSIIAMLKSKNIDINSLNISDKSYNLKDLITKKYIFSIYDTDELKTIENSGKKYSIFKPIDYGFDFYGDILFTSQREYQKHPKRVKDIIKATKKGWRYAFSHIDETIRVIQAKYNTQHFSYSKLKDEATRLKKYMSRDFKFNDLKIKRINDVYLLLDMVSGVRDIHDYLYKPFILSQKEIKFLKNHTIRCISTATWAPFNTLKDGKLAGIAIDYWNIIKNKLQIDSKCKVANNWTTVLSDIKNKNSDITLATSITPKKKKYAIFSKPYASFPIVLATKKNIGFIPETRALKYKKIAVGKNYSVDELFEENYPKINIVKTKNTDEALKLLEEGKVFAVADILPVIAYKIDKYHFSDIKISGRTKWKFKVRMMVRKDYPELISSINKAIDSISTEEKIKIDRKWMAIRYGNGYSLKYILYIVGISAIIILIILAWIIYLKREISKRKKLEKELERLATIDRLTSIYNRYKMDISLQKHMEISKRYKRPLSFIYFDIDHFKRINDTFGHKVGDLVLIQLCSLIKNSIRKSDIFGRWGGEEFLIILPETKKEEAVELAEKLRQKVQNYKFDKIKHLTCSFGVTSNRENDNPEEIMIRIDKRLYKAKKEGRNRVESV